MAETLRELFDNKSVYVHGSSMIDLDAALDCVKDWLQQKRKDTAEGTEIVLNLMIDALLTELNS